LELLLTRDQKSGMMGMGAIKFILHIQAKLTPDEQALIKKYKMDDIAIYEKIPVANMAGALGGVGKLALGLASKALQLQFTVKDLVNGRTLEVKDIVEMMDAEEQIKDAAQNFHIILKAAANFKGEEVISFK
jgi:hypothetical protein